MSFKFKTCVAAFTLASSLCFAKDYNVAFYSDFEPISYAESRDPKEPQFDQPHGYEADLLKAIESIPDSDMHFKFKGIKTWDGLWLQPYNDPKMDIALGGITVEDQRMKDKSGKKVVDTTHKTVSFKQSLLMCTEDVKKVSKHQDLNCTYTVGAVPGTTGEYRFLVQAKLIDELGQGRIVKGATIILKNHEFFTSDGTLSIYDKKLKDRAMLLPPTCSLPMVKYFEAEDSMIPALKAGVISAVARGFIGNQLISQSTDGEFKVTGIFSLECPKEFATTCNSKENAAMYVKADDQELKTNLNKYIDFLTDNGKIDYEDWQKNHHIFQERAKLYRS